MPDTVGQWLFWVSTTIILALILTVGGNLITPMVKRSGEGWLQRRRLKRAKYRQSLEELALAVSVDGTELFMYYIPRLIRLGQIIVIWLMLYLLGAVGFIVAILNYESEDPFFLIMISLLISMISSIILMVVVWYGVSTVNHFMDFRKTYKEMKQGEEE